MPATPPSRRSASNLGVPAARVDGSADMRMHMSQSALLSRHGPWCQLLLLHLHHPMARYLHATNWLKFFTQLASMKKCLRRLVRGSGGPRACPPGFESRSRRVPPLVFYTSCSVGCVWGFWRFPPFELHVYSSMWSEAEGLSEYGVVPE
jgi:hypothetical protein